MIKIHMKGLYIMNKIKKDRGITLIALIATIVALLILAGVSINLVLGNNGIITMAKKAKEQYENAAKREEQILSGAMGKNFQDYNGQLSVTNGQLVNKYGEPIQLRGLVRNTIKSIF